MGIRCFGTENIGRIVGINLLVSCMLILCSIVSFKFSSFLVLKIKLCSFLTVYFYHYVPNI